MKEWLGLGRKINQPCLFFASYSSHFYERPPGIYSQVQIEIDWLRVDEKFLNSWFDNIASTHDAITAKLIRSMA